MSDNPERDVIDAIDALVDEQLAQEASGYDHNLNQPKCELCRGEWHGIPSTMRCPGAHATPEQVAAFKAMQERNTEEYWRQRQASMSAIATQFDRTVLFGGGEVVPQFPRNELGSALPVSIQEVFALALRERLRGTGWEISGDDPFDPTHWLADVAATVTDRPWLPGEAEALDDARPPFDNFRPGWGLAVGSNELGPIPPIHWYADNEETP